MKKFTILIPLLFIMITCAQKDPLIGQWERFGDDAAGAIVMVEKVGDVYHGKLLLPVGMLTELGFTPNEIKWRDMEQVGDDKWRGQDLIKVVDFDGTIISAGYDDVYFTKLEKDVLEVRKFAKGTEIIGTVQKWRRIK
jgi:hypothetical protein